MFRFAGGRWCLAFWVRGSGDARFQLNENHVMSERCIKSQVIWARRVPVIFTILVHPRCREPDIVGAFAAGFVNLCSGYSSVYWRVGDILAAWMLMKRRPLKIRRGWSARPLLGIIPGVSGRPGALSVCAMRRCKRGRSKAMGDMISILLWRSRAIGRA